MLNSVRVYSVKVSVMFTRTECLICIPLFFFILPPVTSCNVDYYLEECAAVVITSPNYPASYDDNKTCSWLVISNELNRLHIQVTDFMTEDSYDNLHIGGGALIGNPVSLFAGGTLSGSAQPVNFTSAQTTVWMRFVTDLDKSARGFRAVVTDLCDIGK